MRYRHLGFSLILLFTISCATMKSLFRLDPQEEPIVIRQVEVTEKNNGILIIVRASRPFPQTSDWYSEGWYYATLYGSSADLTGLHINKATTAVTEIDVTPLNESTQISVLPVLPISSWRLQQNEQTGEILISLFY